MLHCSTAPINPLSFIALTRVFLSFVLSVELIHLSHL